MTIEKGVACLLLLAIGTGSMLSLAPTGRPWTGTIIFAACLFTLIVVALTGGRSGNSDDQPNDSW